MLAFVLIAATAACAIGSHEYFSKARELQELREITMAGYLKEFSWLLNYYEEGCVTGITDEEVEEVQTVLDAFAQRLAVYYPGFTAPKLV